NKSSPWINSKKRNNESWNGKIGLSSNPIGIESLELAAVLNFSSCRNFHRQNFSASESIPVGESNSYFRTRKVIRFCISTNLSPQRFFRQWREIIIGIHSCI